MTIAEMVLEKLRQLRPDQQKVVLDFVESLEGTRVRQAQAKKDARKTLRSLEGLWEDFGIEITEEDIAEARREMWGNFPREIS